MLVVAVFVLSSVLAASAESSAAPHEPKQPFSKHELATVYDKCKVANTAALTFDDGPYLYEKELIATLAKYNAKATFFLNGDNYACIYDDSRVSAVKAIYAAGHELGSHTWTHAHLNKLNWAGLNSEMYKIEQALINIVGVHPALFRPPYGEYDNLALAAIKARNQSAILWDFDSGDSVGASISETDKLYDKLAAKHPSSVLALNHSPYKTTVRQTIPNALKVLHAKGYKFVTVSECLGIPAYQKIQKAGTKDHTWKC